MDSLNVQQRPIRQRGDPRMHKAVAARWKNPRMSLYQALVEGGFVYAEDYPHVVDTDGVSLAQRKNQLSRRLRHTKQQSRKRKKDDDGSSLLDVAALLGLQYCVDQNILTEQLTQPPQQTGNTKVALDQLSRIADTVGLTLAQLADALGNHRNLAQALKGTSGRQQLALAFYKVGTRKLLVDSMLQAGYPKEIAQDESSEDFQMFALAAWLQESSEIQKTKADMQG